MPRYRDEKGGRGRAGDNDYIDEEVPRETPAHRSAQLHASDCKNRVGPGKQQRRLERERVGRELTIYTYVLSNVYVRVSFTSTRFIHHL